MKSQMTKKIFSLALGTALAFLLTLSLCPTARAADVTIDLTGIVSSGTDIVVTGNVITVTTDGSVTLSGNSGGKSVVIASATDIFIEDGTKIVVSDSADDADGRHALTVPGGSTITGGGAGISIKGGKGGKGAPGSSGSPGGSGGSGIYAHGSVTISGTIGEIAGGDGGDGGDGGSYGSGSGGDGGNGISAENGDIKISAGASITTITGGQGGYGGDGGSGGSGDGGPGGNGISAIGNITINAPITATGGTGGGGGSGGSDGGSDGDGGPGGYAISASGDIIFGAPEAMLTATDGDPVAGASDLTLKKGSEVSRYDWLYDPGDGSGENERNDSPLEVPRSTTTYTIRLNVPPAITTTSPLANGKEGVPYTQALTATGTAPIAWDVTVGALPDGLTLATSTDTGDAIISGTPTTEGTFIFTVKAENAAGNDTEPFTITIDPADVSPTITTTLLPNGTAGVAYSETLTATGTAPITWSLTGTLPDGLTLNADGTISGTPTAAGTFTFTVTASNGIDPDATATFTITINHANTPAPADPGDSDSPYDPVDPAISAVSATPRGTGARLAVSAASGPFSQTFQWQMKQANGTWANIHGATGAAFDWENLTPGMTYTVRCIVRNSDGGYAVSREISFTIARQCTGLVTGSNVNLRFGPDARTKSLGKLGKNSAIIILGYEAPRGYNHGFYKIAWGDGFAYISADYVDAAFCEPLSGAISGRAYLQSRMSTSSRYRAFTLGGGDSVTVIGRCKSWWIVDVNGETFYLKNSKYIAVK